MIIQRPKPLPYRRGTVQGFTLVSDLHIGSPEVDEPLIARELTAAVDRGDRIAINGDVFDAILSRDAKRYTPSCVAPWLRGRNDMLNAALDRASDLLRPYTLSIDMVGCGNHESSVEKHHNVDLIRLLCDRLSVPYGGYTGFLDYRFVPANRNGRSGTGRRFVVYYHHGSGGGGTMGAAANDLHKRHAFIDADVIWLGHRHHRLSAHMRRLSCPVRGYEPSYRDVRYVMSGAYLDTYKGQTQGGIRKRGRRASYASDAGLPPQGKGGARVVVECGSDGPERVTVEM